MAAILADVAAVGGTSRADAGTRGCRRNGLSLLQPSNIYRTFALVSQSARDASAAAGWL
jgi:hypothetical protein